MVGKKRIIIDYDEYFDLKERISKLEMELDRDRHSIGEEYVNSLEARVQGLQEQLSSERLKSERWEGYAHELSGELVRIKNRTLMERIRNK